MLMSNEDETALHGCHCRGDKLIRVPRSWYMCASVLIIDLFTDTAAILN